MNLLHEIVYRYVPDMTYICGVLWDCSERQSQYNTYIIIFIKVEVGLQSGTTQWS